MVDIEAALRPLVDHPESPPRPVSDIASRARRRRMRRRSAAAALAVAGLAALGTRLSLDSSADTTTVDRPTDTSVPTTAPPSTTAPTTSTPATTAPTSVPTTPPAPPTTASPPESVPSGPVDPFDRIEPDGQDVRTAGDGDYVAFEDVRFGTSLATRFEARVASGVGPGAGGTIEVRLDDVASPPFATIAVAGTGSWTTFTTLAADTPAIGGTHDIYVTFGSGEPGDFAAVDWFRFRR